MIVLKDMRHDIIRYKNSDVPYNLKLVKFYDDRSEEFPYVTYLYGEDIINFLHSMLDGEVHITYKESDLFRNHYQNKYRSA